jgi:hypothetical protein
VWARLEPRKTTLCVLTGHAIEPEMQATSHEPDLASSPLNTSSSFGNLNMHSVLDVDLVRRNIALIYCVTDLAILAEEAATFADFDIRPTA